MSQTTPNPTADLPAAIARALNDFLAVLRETFGDRLVCAALFGSAAEGRVRATSDVNLAIVTRSYTRADADRLREPLTLAHAAIALNAMFLAEDELGAAAEAFAAKFADIRRRRRVLVGRDVFADVTIPRAAEIHRVKQVLLNLVLRTRTAYALRSTRDEQVPILLADLAGPLRACAAALLELEGAPAADGRQALLALAGPRFRDAVESLARVRQGGRLPPDEAAETLFALLDLAQQMRGRVAALRAGA
jgi:predicted nucleotidyltransferase